jgi:branched-chain amino acid transport system permease protein
MLGAYAGYTAVHLTGSFWIALVIAPLVVGLVGATFELGILRRLYRRDGSAFLMVTFGLTLILGEAIRLIWGVAALEVPPPKSLSGIVFILDQPFPVYRLFLAAAGVVVALAIWQFLERTRLGLLIRATSQNAEMVHALGTDVRLVRSAVFGIGCGLAGIGGVFAAPLVTASLGMAPNAVIDTFVIVIIGGMGSFAGSLIGALLVAFVQVFGTYYFPDLAMAFMYLIMLAVLVVRPGGLLGKEA